MTKRERAEQRRIAFRLLRRELRAWARARRVGANAEYGSRVHERATADGNAAFGEVMGMRSLSAALGVIPFDSQDWKQLCRRIERINHAQVTRRPFRLVTTGTA